jgi:Zn-dependent membrane protease YugP
MTKSVGIRRASSVFLVALGIVLMLFTPGIWPGALLFSLGVVLELVGIALEHKTN